MAGINSARKVQAAPPLILDRSQAYIGVLIDDLVTLGTKEPYRLFTSRAEYRLLLREDNADLRLRRIGHEIGLVSEQEWEAFLRKETEIEGLSRNLDRERIQPGEAVNAYLKTINSSPLSQAMTLSEMLRRPEITIEKLKELIQHGQLDFLPRPEQWNYPEEVQLQVKYAGYIKRQEEQVARFKKLESVELPEDISYEELPGLSSEVVEKLSAIQPRSLGQALRISGVTPAAISVLQVHLRKMGLI